MKMPNFALPFQHCKNALFQEWAKMHILFSIQYVNSVLLCDDRTTQRIVG